MGVLTSPKPSSLSGPQASLSVRQRPLSRRFLLLAGLKELWPRKGFSPSKGGVAWRGRLLGALGQVAGGWMGPALDSAPGWQLERPEPSPAPSASVGEGLESGDPLRGVGVMSLNAE